MTSQTAVQIQPQNSEQPITAYHAKYYARELTKRSPSDSLEKLTGVLADAQVALNPHQIEAALFAFRSPLSRGAILADEVGLGKTIEAGLLLSQKWAKKERRLLVIVPANLRKQWSQELKDKFFLQSYILETKTFNEEMKKGNLNPLDRNGVIICSYQFARIKASCIADLKWDLVVIDEAHRLRNVYKKKPSNKIANAIKTALAPFQKVLLTATPLQNGLMELYGLVSVVDEHIFGNQKSFRRQFARGKENPDFANLKERLATICKRTLRKQVLEYIKFTNRHAIVQEFVHSKDERELYERFSDYLKQEELYALPDRCRPLMTMILRKLMASSTYAISPTLEGLANKLQAMDDGSILDEDMLLDVVAKNYEEADELAEEWDEDGEAPEVPARNKKGNKLNKLNKILASARRNGLQNEIDTLRELHVLAKSIKENSKGHALLTALRKGFEASTEAQKSGGAATLQKKAIIFTESRRTQEYIYEILEQTEFKGKIVLFNGTNNDLKSQEIYQKWMERNKGTDKISGSASADKRAALTQYFRNEAVIMIATEAAAEGINLQFCNLVVNYDLPWNPQRIEQRIGRCHRYGQKFDVIVVNFLNIENAADIRVYQLLSEKFKLFDGVFGSSDEVMGAIGSGIDFEKRIADICQRCRTEGQINADFDKLQADLEQEVVNAKSEAHQQLLNNFDEKVIEKVKIDSENYLGRFEERLWALTRHALDGYARFDDKSRSFTLDKSPFPDGSLNLGAYRLSKDVEDANTYRIGHPLAQRLIEDCKQAVLSVKHIVFNYSKSGKKILALQSLVGKSGWMKCTQETINSLETEDHILLAGVLSDGTMLDLEQCHRLFDLQGMVSTDKTISPEIENQLNEQIQEELENILLGNSTRDMGWCEAEIQKLDQLAEDQRDALKEDLKELDEANQLFKKVMSEVENPPDMLRFQREMQNLERKRGEVWREYDEDVEKIHKEKDKLLDMIDSHLKLKMESQDLMTISFEVA